MDFYNERGAVPLQCQLQLIAASSVISNFGAEVSEPILMKRFMARVSFPRPLILRLNNCVS